MAKKTLLLIGLSLVCFSWVSRGESRDMHQCPFGRGELFPYSIRLIDLGKMQNPFAENLRESQLLNRQESFQIFRGRGAHQAVAILDLTWTTPFVRMNLHFPQGGRPHVWEDLKKTVDECFFEYFRGELRAGNLHRVEFLYDSSADKNSVAPFMETLVRLLKLRKFPGSTVYIL